MKLEGTYRSAAPDTEKRQYQRCNADFGDPGGTVWQPQAS